jgi:hypothetical protein
METTAITRKLAGSEGRKKKNYGLSLEALEEYRSMYVWMTLAQISYLFFHSFSGDESNTVGILRQS